MYSLGIDIGGTNVKIAVIDENDVILHKHSFKSIYGDPTELVDRICGAFAEIEIQYNIANVGVCCPGADSKTGYAYADNLGWKAVPLKNIIEERLNRTIGFANDGAAAMLAETRKGALKDHKTGVYLTLGTGIGGGFLFDGKPYTGNKGVTPEFGHMITHGGGRECACGAQGCFERYASADALKKSAPGYGAKKITEMAQTGDPNMGAIWKAYIKELAVGIIGIMSLLYPECIVLGGGLSEAGDFLLDSVRNELKDNEAVRLYYSDICIKLGLFKGDAGIVGAAFLGRENPRKAG